MRKIDDNDSGEVDSRFRNFFSCSMCWLNLYFTYSGLIPFLTGYWTVHAHGNHQPSKDGHYPFRVIASSTGIFPRTVYDWYLSKSGTLAKVVCRWCCQRHILHLESSIINLLISLESARLPLGLVTRSLRSMAIVNMPT